MDVDELSPGELHTIVQLTYTAQDVSWPFTALSTVLFMLRIVSRFYIKDASLHWDDLFLFVGWILNLLRGIFYQLGYFAIRKIQISDIGNNLSPATFWIGLASFWGYLCIPLPKLSIALLLVHIFRPRRWLKYCILGSCYAFILMALVGFILCFVQCSPPSTIWKEIDYPNEKCWSPDVMIVYDSVAIAIAAFIDLAFAVYPGIIIWSLQMPNWKKYSTTALMSLGLASCAFALVKLDYATKFRGATTVSLYKRAYYAIYASIWNSLESDFVLSAASLPSTPPFFRVCYAYIKQRFRRDSVLSWRSGAPLSQAIAHENKEASDWDDTLDLHYESMWRSSLFSDGDLQSEVHLDRVLPEIPSGEFDVFGHEEAGHGHGVL